MLCFILRNCAIRLKGVQEEYREKSKWLQGRKVKKRRAAGITLSVETKEWTFW